MHYIFYLKKLSKKCGHASGHTTLKEKKNSFINISHDISKKTYI